MINHYLVLLYSKVKWERKETERYWKDMAVPNKESFYSGYVSMETLSTVML